MQDQAKLLQDEMQKETTGKSQEEAQKIVQEKSAKMQALQSAAQNKIKQSFETAAASVAQEKKLSAILVKEAVPQGGTDVTEDIIKKMQ
jgi:outer membrane protein